VPPPRTHGRQGRQDRRDRPEQGDAEKVAAEVKGVALHADVTDEEQIKRRYQRPRLRTASRAC